MATENDPPQKGKGRTSAVPRRAKSPVTIDLEADATSSGRQETTVANLAADREAVSNPGEPPRSEPDSRQPNSHEKDAAITEEKTTGANEVSGPAPTRPGILALAGAGLAGGFIVLVLGFGLLATGLLPVPGREDATQALAEADRLAGTISALDQRLTSIEAASAQTIADRALIDDLARQVGVVDAFGTSLSDRLLNTEASIASLGEGLNGNDDAATRQLLDTIEERVERLENAPSESNESRSAATLQTPLDNIDPVATDVAPPATKPGTATASKSENEDADAVVIEAPEINSERFSALTALAEKSVPSLVELAREFPAIADAILAAQQAPDSDAGFFDRMLSYGNSLIKIQPAEPVSGDGPSAIVARMRVAVEKGDFAGALAEWDVLPPAGQRVSRQWAEAAADRLVIDRLFDEVANAPGAGEERGQAASQ